MPRVIHPWSGPALAIMAAAVMLLGSDRLVPAAPAITTDVLVYGGTPSGVIAAVAAARAGADVVLVEPTGRVGGMMSNGLSWTDRGDATVIGGMAGEFFDLVQEAEGSLRGRFAFQPHTAEEVFGVLLADAGVPVVEAGLLGPDGVIRDGPRIDRVDLDSGLAYRPAVVVDASYEGDLMAWAGVSYRIGREAVAEYDEPLAGVRPSEVVMDVPDGVDPGVPLAEPGAIGSADERIQASNYRLCLTTDPDNQLPFPVPNGYDPASYDLQAEYFAQRIARGELPDREWAVNLERTIRGKWDLNAVGPLSVSLPGANYDYPEASAVERLAIARAHRDYQAGYLYFLDTDPRVPAVIRDSLEPFGLCADEFLDHDGWPPMLYLREGRRLVGEVVVTQHDIDGVRSKPDVIGLASYRMDSHRVSRWVDTDGRLRTEGELNSRAPMRWAIPYRAITPRRADATNLLVPVAASASHVAYSSLRMEPQYMIMGQAAGTAAAIAAAGGLAVQDVVVEELQAALRVTGAVLDDPGDIATSTFYDEISWAYFEGIIGHCAGPGLFCPEQPVTRQMMAAFLARALDLPPATADYFSDDDGSSMEGSINRVAEAGITSGCAPNSFCPTATVTRAEMAAFLVRAYDVPPGVADRFTDDDEFQTHEDEIDALAASGIATGCGPTTFCPGDPVTRGQMMAFLQRATPSP